jgi:IS5 family transposase
MNVRDAYGRVRKSIITIKNEQAHMSQLVENKAAEKGI